MQPEESKCPAADAQSAEPGSRSGPVSPQSVPGFAKLVEMHEQLMALVGALLEQNAALMEMLSAREDEREEEPSTYLDGSKR